jgi:hypothetical protein
MLAMMLNFLCNWIKNNYCPEHGLLTYGRSKICCRLGVHKKYQQIAWDKVEQFFIVYSGNICRSTECDRVLRSEQLAFVGLWRPKRTAHMHNAYNTNSEYFSRYEVNMLMVVDHIISRLL